MKRVLISFIGTGRKAEGEISQEYEEAIYQFPDGSRYKSSLITSTLYDYLKPDKIIVLGTSDSIWAELSQMSPELLRKSRIYDDIWEETWDDSKRVTEPTLSRWENLINNKLDVQISLNLIPKEAEDEIVEVIFKELPENIDEVYLDITHAFRHFPLIAAFALPVLKYVKNFKRLTLIYAKLKAREVSPVYFLATPNKLLELLEAVSNTDHSGNFSKFSAIYNTDLFSKVYLQAETNRPISRKTISNLNSLVDTGKNVCQSIASVVIKRDVIPCLKGEYLENRMANRAVFFAEKYQFLKAYTLIYEAIITAIIRKFYPGMSGNIDNINLRLKVSKNLKDYFPSKDNKTIFLTVRDIRNSIVHGSKPKSGQVISALQNPEELKYWVRKGKELVDNLQKK